MLWPAAPAGWAGPLGAAPGTLLGTPGPVTVMVPWLAGSGWPQARVGTPDGGVVIPLRPMTPISTEMKAVPSGRSTSPEPQISVGSPLLGVTSDFESS